MTVFPSMISFEDVKQCRAMMNTQTVRRYQREKLAYWQRIGITAKSISKFDSWLAEDMRARSKRILAVKRALQAIPDTSAKEILTRRYISGNSLLSIAVDLGIDRCTAYRIEQRAKELYFAPETPL